MAKSSLLLKISKKVKISGISSDSRLVKKDDVFFAVTGYLIDGSKFIDDAIKRNASAIVTSNKKIKKKKVPVFYVNDVREALSYTAYDFYNSKINNLIAVTGTNGKTSVSYFIYHILRKLNKKVGIIGTIGNSIDVKEKTTLTTPDPISIAKILKKMKEKKVKYVVMEASSHGLEQKRLCGLNFDLAIMTNISHDHLDFHKNFQNYLNSKMRLFKRHLKTSGTAIINENTNEIKKIKKSLKNNKNVHYFKSEKSNFNILKIKRLTKTHIIVLLEYLNKEYSFSFKNIPFFQIENLLLAYYSLVKYGFSFEKISKVITKVPQIPGRMQFVSHKKTNNAKVFVDFAHTPDALEKVLIEARKMTSGNLHVLFGCGGNRDRSKRKKMGAISIRYADSVIVTDDNPRFEDPKKIRQEIIGRANSIINISNRKTAIKRSIKKLKHSDLLVIAGKGHEKYQIINDVYHKFDDVKIAKEICEQS